MAAGGLLVREAGGVVADWAGDDQAWLRSGNVLAAPPGVVVPAIFGAYRWPTAAS